MSTVEKKGPTNLLKCLNTIICPLFVAAEMVL